MSRGSSAGYDRHITIFSPQGKLYQVEYAFKAVRNSSMTSIGIRGKDACVLVTQKKVPDKLLDASSVTHMFSIAPGVGCCVTGLIADAKSLVARARRMAAEFQYKNGYSIPVHFLAKQLADEAQVKTQKAFMRAYGIVTMLVAVDDESGPGLFMVDPTGFFMGYHACAAGQKEQEANNLLEKKIKELGTDISTDKLLETAIIGLQNVVGTQLKPNEMEVAIVSRDDTRFHVLTEDEIDAQLTKIADSVE